jgi:hypothetical protein
LVAGATDRSVVRPPAIATALAVNKTALPRSPDRARRTALAANKDCYP